MTKNYRVNVKSLYCKTTEDASGSDECELRFIADGVDQTTKKKDLNDGETWTINYSMEFDSTAALKLWDDDTGILDSDDFLGEVAIVAQDGDHSGTFTKDGANYTVNYHVTWLTAPPPPPPPVDLEVSVVSATCIPVPAGAFGRSISGNQSAPQVTKPSTSFTPHPGSLQLLNGSRELFSHQVKVEETLHVRLVAGALHASTTPGGGLYSHTLAIPVKDIPHGESYLTWTVNGAQLDGEYDLGAWDYDIVLRLSATNAVDAAVAMVKEVVEGIEDAVEDVVEAAEGILKKFF